MVSNKDAESIPDSYVNPASEVLQGEIQEVEYSVSNYINALRCLITNQDIDSETAGREAAAGEPIMKKCNVYLPAGYDGNDVQRRYNVMYLLHGVGGDQYEWLSSKAGGRAVIANIFDHLIANGEIEPLIVVFPNGRSAQDWTDRSFNSQGTNMLGFYYFDYELRYDLIPFIEANYHTYADIADTSFEAIAYNRLHRAIAGLSMGGMQALNLIVGGYRHDSITVTATESPMKNGLDKTVLAAGLTDLFAYVGAFSNAPTSSEGKVLGSSLASSAHKLSLLYATCGDADFAYESYCGSIAGLVDAAGIQLQHYYEVVIKDGNHDFNVWHNGAYNFSRLAFASPDQYLVSRVVQLTL